MDLIRQIPLRFVADEVARRVRFRPGAAGYSALDDLVREALSLIDLRAVTTVWYIDRKDRDSVEIGGMVFRSRVLRQNLKKAQKVFPYVLTAGPGVETAAGSAGLLKQYYLEEMANIALKEGLSWLTGRLQIRWGFSLLSNMSPGSLEDWPLTEQTKLFALLSDTEKAIGVKLTESLLMIPRKSLSGILFPSEEEFTSCQLCPRESCPSRKAPFDEKKAAGFSSDGSGSGGSAPSSSRERD